MKFIVKTYTTNFIFKNTWRPTSVNELPLYKIQSELTQLGSEASIYKTIKNYQIRIVVAIHTKQFIGKFKYFYDKFTQTY